MYAKELRKLNDSFLSELRDITNSDTVEIFVLDSEIRIKPHREKTKAAEVLDKYAGILKKKNKVYEELLKYRAERDQEDREVPDIGK